MKEREGGKKEVKESDKKGRRKIQQGEERKGVREKRKMGRGEVRGLRTEGKCMEKEREAGSEMRKGMRKHSRREGRRKSGKGRITEGESELRG